MDVLEDDYYLAHYGIKRKSGRYPWGSGDNPEQRSRSFKTYNEMMSKENTPKQIADAIQEYARAHGDPHAKISTTDLRAMTSISTEYILAENQAIASRLSAKGMSNGEIAVQMGLPRSAESTVRGWLKHSEGIKEGTIRATAEALKRHVEDKPFLDVGKGTNLYMGVAETRFKTALASLRDEGYVTHAVKNPQLGTTHQTEYKVLTKEGIPWSEARKAVVEGRVQNITDHSDDGGLNYKTPNPEPVSVASKRIAVRYAEDGGDKMDGVIELRRGVPDIDLGSARYAQVRVAVDKSHYLKGMAMYADDLPAGVDVRFNTNKKKSETASNLDAFKPMKMTDGKIDPDNPFGASTYPKTYVDKKGKEQTSALRIVYEEGQWDKWGKALSSQMLSKQPVSLAITQLGKARQAKIKELGEIERLTNPVVKRKMLEDYAESADAAAVHLKAAARDRQTTAVLLPMKSVRPTEIYAPNHEHGEKVVLVRHPHGGPFEIPELTVNLRNAEAKRLIGNAKDAVGIHHSVAHQLSGADFDGDTVLVIPNASRAIRTQRPLKDLEGFDPKSSYPGYEGMKTMSKKNTQTEMGKISNLITDMTISKAPANEIAQAVRHSMVVIDAEKHGLNYKLSERDNGIAELKKTYQGVTAKGMPKGAATLISRASADVRVPEFRPRKAKDGGPVDPKTGEKMYELTGVTYFPKPRISKRTGEPLPVKEKPRTITISKAESVKDLNELSSGQLMETVYATHGNTMKALANKARMDAHPDNLKMPSMSPNAKALYRDEVASLDAKLKTAQRNAPLERRAQSLGGAWAQAKIDSHPEYDKDDIKKVKFQSLEDARHATGANKVKIVFTDREWEAIQARAVSASKLTEMLHHSDMDRVKELATPRARSSLTPGQQARARQMAALGRPLSEIAAELGVPRSTLADNLS